MKLILDETDAEMKFWDGFGGHRDGID